jgi:hypothetical protein
MLKRVIIIVTAAVLILSAGSCKRNHYNINVTGSEVELKIKRLEQDLFNISPGSLADSIPYLRSKYGSFLGIFGYFIHIGNDTNPSWTAGLISFSTDKVNNEVYASVSSVFPDISGLEKELSGAFSRYSYYFPSKAVPELFTCTTGFNYSIITSDSVLGISLDRYLGAECKFYRQLGLYKYQVAKMTPLNIPSDCMYGWASARWEYGAAGYERDNVLSSIIHEGKLLYFVKCMLPEKDDNLVFGYSPEQMKFCINNEGRMWQYLIENNLLFNSEQLTKKKLTGEAPFTSFFSTESPGRAAAWLGFRIVESFMKRNSNVTLERLMTETDVQGILEMARYHPPAG